MPSKYRMILDLASQTAKNITADADRYTDFLITAANNYKYSFKEQLLIHAQKPDATACAEIDTWNKLGRWVNKGTKGIALLIDRDVPYKLRHVFDISDTNSRAGRNITLWQMKPEYEYAVSESLQASFGDVEEPRDFPHLLMDISGYAVEDNLSDYLMELNAVKAGSFLEELVLPGSLRVIGSCAFYNCRRLRRLSAGAGELTMGSDVFLNCFALEDLIIRATPEQATGLFALVGSITEAVRALFWPVGEASPRAGLWYPAYWEDIEETPAHILLHTFSGQGYHYRQCFLENKLLPAEYDAIFPQGHDADDASVMAMLCFDRLRWPWQLSDAARDAYRDFLKTNTGRVLTRLLKAQDTEGIKVLLALDVMDTDAFAEGAALAAKADNAEAAALLADAEHKKRAAAPQKKRYDFDF